MSKNNKKIIRQNFRDSVFKRAKYACEGSGCNFKSSKENAEFELDAHHIGNRTLMPNGGYVLENGIALCSNCHVKAEQFWSKGSGEPGFSSDELYKKIGSSFEIAKEKSFNLKGNK